MVSVKIECGCGQRYVFDVEPVNGRMASRVACPVCGADGTAAANSVIAAKLSPPVAPPAGPSRAAAEPVSASVPAGVRVNARVLGLVDREAAASEARAKISWGDSREEVIRFLMLQGYAGEEAAELVRGFFRERLVALRVKGVRKIVLGLALMCVPVIAWFAHLALISLKLMGAAIGAGLWGAWLVLNGVILVAAPRMESGDVAE